MEWEELWRSENEVPPAITSSSEEILSSEENLNTSPVQDNSQKTTKFPEEQKLNMKLSKKSENYLIL